MQDRGVGSWIERRARTSPDAPAIVWGDTTRSYADAADRIRRLASALRTRGVARGDRVAWLGPNHPAFLETLFATAKLGAVLVPINHRLEDEAIRAIVEAATPRLAVVERTVRDVDLPNVDRRLVVGTGPSDEAFEGALAAAPGEDVDERIDLGELCLLQFTSGTTGTSKGVMLTHGNVTWNAINLLSAVELRRDDVTVAIAPFFRTGGTGVNVLPMLFHGGCVVVPERLEPDAILDEIVARRVTVGFANPDLLDALARAPAWPSADLSRLRLIITGGAPVPERLIETYLGRDVPLVQGYGLTEAAPVVLVLDEAAAHRKIGAAGRPPLFVDVRIVDRDGHPVGPGVTGELVARGPNVMAGYWNDPDATAGAVDPDGWLHTGDAARVDEDGDVWIVGRTADAFATDGGTIHPGDVERVLLSHAGVRDAAVVPDVRSGVTLPVAFVVLEPGSALDADDLRGDAEPRLATHQAPREIRFIDALPRTSVGKLRRDELMRLLDH
jgi:fatty-acyl-CoA synthase